MRKSPDAVVEQAAVLCERLGRSDLSSSLEHARRRIENPTVRVLVVGEFKQGKSRLVNALVGAPVCVVDDRIASAVPVEVSAGPKPRACLLVMTSDAGSDPQEESVPVTELVSRLVERQTEQDTPAMGERRIVGARAWLPRELLAAGLTVVDTPGVGGLSSTHAARTLATLPSADAVLLVTDAGSEFSAPEIAFLRQALDACPTVACVLTKTDLYPQWRRIAEANRGHLSRLGLDLPIIPVSSELRQVALASGDAEINSESGFPDLVGHLQRDVLGHREQLTAASVRQDVGTVAESLLRSLRSERLALEDPSTVPEMVMKFTEARTRADELKRRSARWQVTLSDGVADLNADIDHDLRDRLRTVVREAEAAIDESDPGEAWPQFASWFESRVAACIADTFLWAERSAEWLAEQVGQHFSDDAQAATPPIDLGEAAEVVSPVGSVAALDAGELKPVQKMIIGMRGSYGGVLMVGLVTGLAGLALVNPISVGAGLLLGTRAYRDDTDVRLRKRQAEAKVIIRRHVDDVTFHVSKQLRDRLRLIQRNVRDHYTQVAEELSQSLTASLASAQQAAKAGTAERSSRLAAVVKEIEAVKALVSAANALQQIPALAPPLRSQTSGPSPAPKAGGPSPAPKAGGPSPAPKAGGPSPAPKAGGPSPAPKPGGPGPSHQDSTHMPKTDRAR